MTPSPTPAAAEPQAPAERPRVGLWLGLLLLFVPVFYPLLYLRPYSWLARLGWGGWLGLIVFVKLSGLSEPVINLSQLERELSRQEQGQAAPERTARDTFVRPEQAEPAPPPLADYLRELGGGVLGRRIVDYRVQGDAIRIRFPAMDWYLGSEQAVALESIGAALSLFYGRDFHTVELHFVLQGRPLEMVITREGFNAFFAMSEAAVRDALARRSRREASVFDAERLPPELQQAFFERFAAYP